MALQPLEDRIVVRPSESEEKTASGLVIPDTAKEKPQQGEVLAVGPGRRADNTGDLIPLDDRIVVRPNESEETTASGLVIPDTAKEKPQQGEVLAAGPGRRAENTGELIPLDVKVGDTVVYSKYGGTEITVDGEDLLILTGRDVLATVTKK